MKLFLLLILFIVFTANTQENIPYNGIKPSKNQVIAIINATIYVSPTEKIENGTLILENDKIIKVSKGGNLPKNALVLDYKNKIILPAFIEVNSSLGIPKAVSNATSYPQIASSKTGAYHWNEAIHPEIDAANLYQFDTKQIDEYLKMGFGFVSTHQNDGIIQGTSTLVSLGKENYSQQIVKRNVSTHLSFNKGVSNQDYPSSQMGSIALLRQTFYDLNWYKTEVNKKTNLSYDALINAISKPLLFETEDKYEILRAEKIAKEFGFTFHYLCSGNEYQITEELKNSKSIFVLPLNYPSPYDVKDPYVSKIIPLSDLKHWENASYNASILSKNNLKFAFTSNKLNPSDFWKNIKKTLLTGLTESQILEALTVNPAKILGLDKEIGTLDAGKKASFVVYNSNPFQEEAYLLETWLLGEKTTHQLNQEIDIRGKYNMVVDDAYFQLEITGSIDKPIANLSVKKTVIKEVKPTKKSKKVTPIVADTSKIVKITTPINIQGNDLLFNLNSPELKWKGNLSFHAKIIEKFSIIEGDVILPDGKWMKWSALKNDTVFITKKKIEPEEINAIPYSIWFPNLAYGFENKPKKENIVIENVTLWTNEKDGIIQKGYLLVNDGKISKIGSGGAPNTSNHKLIDGKGMHLTPGIIDEHSHIAISRGVNEGSQAITSEVSISDVVRADDIDIYRQLSGGVTTSQLLHGSANPIGGQSAIIKLKWGHSPQEMLFPNAPKFIKFALGENVKQSNWGEHSNLRFPQTRMGVEQLMFDAFGRAKKYNEEKAKNLPNFQVDLELEALGEILKKERFITCHSYIQSEINMLMHLADSFQFTLNTFTHILEGYKVADKMKKHGAGASTFADWWAYKYEVNEAIPQNASLLNEMGIITAINSDDAEMGRRLNQEAAKAVKYGGTSEQEALKMVTLNPAKLLHIDKQVGSLKTGKDADIVLWSDNPLSINAKVVMTIIDGEILYDASQNQALEERNAKEKARIIAKMLDQIEKGDKPMKYILKSNGHFHCNTIGEFGSTQENQH